MEPPERRRRPRHRASQVSNQTLDKGIRSENTTEDTAKVIPIRRRQTHQGLRKAKLEAELLDAYWTLAAWKAGSLDLEEAASETQLRVSRVVGDLCRHGSVLP